MSKLEVNQISKTPTGTEVTIQSDLYLDAPVKFASYTTAQINALQNPVDGQLVYDTDEGTVKVYKGSTSVWTQVGGTEHTQAFNTISVQGQLDVVTTTQNDYLIFTAGDDITITTNPANKTVQFDVAPLDTSAVGQHIIPSTDNLYDLGSSSFKWNEAYIQDTIHMGNSSIQAVNIGVNDDKITFSDN